MTTPQTTPQKAPAPRRSPFRTVRHVATWSVVVLTSIFVVVFFGSQAEPRQLDDVAPRAGMSTDELLAIGPRVASQSGATLGSSRRVVFLLACSGLANRQTIEAQALQAGTLAKQRRLTDREAVTAVLAERGPGDNLGDLNDC